MRYRLLGRNRLLDNALLLGCAAALGACQATGAPGLARNGMERPAPGETDLGRAHLAAQRNGLAIEAFNRALVFGEPAAPALNGLGVAYARLGRADLAYRFFTQASAADPANPLYARNLATLTQSDGFTLAALRPQAARPLVAPAAPAPREPGKLYRDGNRQFTLLTRPADRIATSCAVSFKGVRPRNCTQGALPAVAARNKVRPAAPVAATPAANAVDKPVRTAARKTVTFGAASALPVVIGPQTGGKTRQP